METTIRDLLKSEFFTPSQLQAGKKGLLNKILSVTFLDSPDGAKFLKGGELVITTGYCFAREKTLQKYVVQALSDKGAAGLAIKLRFFENNLPEIIKETADAFGLPVIILPEDVAHSDINDLIISQKEMKVQQVFNEINYSLYYDGFLGVAQTLYKYTGAQTVVILGDYHYAYPSNYQIPDFIFDSRAWGLKKGYNMNNLYFELFSREAHGRKIEWISSGFKFRESSEGKIILIKGEEDFTYDNMRIIEYATSVCTLKVDYYKSCLFIEREHSRNFLDDLFNGKYTEGEARKKAEIFNYYLPPKGSTVIFSFGAEEIYSVRDRIETIVEKVFGKKILRGIIEKNNYLIYPEYKSENKNNIKKLYKDIKKEFKDINITVGISRPTIFQNIVMSFNEAIGAIRGGKYCENFNKIFEFEDIGFYRLLLSNNLGYEMVRYHEDYLVPLEKYDYKHNTELLETLKYLSLSSYNYKTTAEKMFIHPNTVRYRIRMIENILGMDLSLYEDRYLLETALKLLPIVKDHISKSIKTEIDIKNDLGLHYIHAYISQVTDVEVKTMTRETKAIESEIYHPTETIIDRLGFEEQCKGSTLMSMRLAMMEDYKMAYCNY